MSPSVKGCTMPALTRRPDSTRASQAGRRRTSLEGGNRGMHRWRLGSLPVYGDLKGCTRAGRGDEADQLLLGSCSISPPGADTLNDPGWSQAPNPIIPAQGKAVRYRHWTLKSRRLADASGSGHAHGAPRNGGGARIGCPRIRTSTTIIAAPQSGQTKVG